MKGCEDILILKLSIVLMALAVLERVVFKKMDKSWDKLRVVIGVIITFVLLLISYFITDTGVGFMYTFLGMGVFITITLISFRCNREAPKHLSNLLGLPLMAILLLKMQEHSLVRLNLIILAIAMLNIVLTHSYKRKRNKKENISLGIGILFVVIITYLHFNFTNIEDKYIFKQENMAAKYLEEELNIKDPEIFMDEFFGSLRGEEVIIIAYDENGNRILITYKNNKIVSHEIED